MVSRREMLKKSALMCGLAGTPGWSSSSAMDTKRKLKIGACDWSIGKRSDLAAFEVAREIGLEGIQVNLGSAADNIHLRDPERQTRYLEESKRTGVKIASVALGELNQVPYKSDPRTEEWVWDSVDVAHNLGVDVVLLAFFSKNDLRNDEAGKKEVINRLRKVAPKAEKKGVILGLETYLSAEEHIDIIQAVGSESIKVYYDFRNSADAGYDVIKEIKWLGKDTICELHMKENGALLGKGTLDWKRIGETLKEMEYYGSGWMQIEGARPGGVGFVESGRSNLGFLSQCLVSKMVSG